MADPKPIPLPSGSGPARHAHGGVARIINGYVEDQGEDAKNQVIIVACDGLKAFASVASGGGVRELLALDASLYAVSDREVYVFDTQGAPTLLGGFPSDAGVTMARNRASPVPQIGIVSTDGLYFVIQSGGVLSQISDPDLPPPNSVCHMDGYFVLTVPDGRFVLTAIDDATAIDGLDFATAEANPDGLLIGKVRGRDLCLFGPKSIEFWRNTGGEFPFSRTMAIEVGTLSSKSVANIEQTIAFIADDGTVRALDGYSAVRISTHAVERSIASEPSKSTIKAIAYSRRGHSFYSLVGTDFTWEYNFTTKRWHERESYGLTRWRVASYAEFDGRYIVGDYAAGKLYELDPDTDDEDGSPHILVAQLPPVHASPAALRFNALFVDALPGVGINSSATQDADPELMMDWSDDGQTWSSIRTARLGKDGRSRTRVSFRRLGAIKRNTGRTFRLKVSAKVAKAIFGAAIDADALAV